MGVIVLEVAVALDVGVAVGAEVVVGVDVDPCALVGPNSSRESARYVALLPTTATRPTKPTITPRREMLRRG